MQLERKFYLQKRNIVQAALNKTMNEKKYRLF
jgi:hypothetical protein